MPDIVLIAHGSPDPRHREGLETLAEAVRTRVRPGRAVGVCYLDHHAPSPADLAVELGASAVAVPILLTPAYHARVDVPRAAEELASAGSHVRVARPLGPDRRLLDGCEELLVEAGVLPRRTTAVAVFVAGSSDTAAVATVAETIADHPREGWGPWRVAALDGGRAVEEVVAELSLEADEVVAVSFMVAEGVLRDRMAERTARLGVEMVSGALSSTGALADLVVARAAQRLGLMMSA